MLVINNLMNEIICEGVIHLGFKLLLKLRMCHIDRQLCDSVVRHN